MSLVSQISSLATRIGTEFKSVRSSIGTLANLTTTEKSNIVGAVNEVNGKIGAAGAQIDDSAASTTKVYSSSKTASEIASASTADRNRTNHTGQQTASTISDFASAADARISAQKGAASGLATLDSGSKIPAAQLPSYVDDVLEYANLAAFPGTGETGKIYTAIDNGKIYRWSGSVYVEISGSPGSTDAVPEGSTNLYFTNARAQTATADRLIKTNNLSDLNNLVTARTNLDVYSKTEIGDVNTNFVTVFETAIA